MNGKMRSNIANFNSLTRGGTQIIADDLSKIPEHQNEDLTDHNSRYGAKRGFDLTGPRTASMLDAGGLGDDHSSHLQE